VNWCVRGAPSRSEICLARAIPGLSTGSAVGDPDDWAAAAGVAGGGGGDAPIPRGCRRFLTVVYNETQHVPMQTKTYAVDSAISCHRVWLLCMVVV